MAIMPLVKSSVGMPPALLLPPMEGMPMSEPKEDVLWSLLLL